MLNFVTVPKRAVRPSLVPVANAPARPNLDPMDAFVALRGEEALARLMHKPVEAPVKVEPQAVDQVYDVTPASTIIPAIYEACRKPLCTSRIAQKVGCSVVRVRSSCKRLVAAGAMVNANEGSKDFLFHSVPDMDEIVARVVAESVPGGSNRRLERRRAAVLKAVRENDGIRAGELSTITGLEKSAVRRALTHLLGQGMIVADDSPDNYHHFVYRAAEGMKA